MTITWAAYNDDLFITKGKLLTVYGAEEVKQRVIITLKHYWEEYFLNVPAGVPWYEFILGNKDLKSVESILRSTVLQVPGVIGILSFYLTFANRDLAISMQLEVQGQQAPEVIEIVFNRLGAV